MLLKKIFASIYTSLIITFVIIIIVLCVSNWTFIRQIERTESQYTAITNSLVLLTDTSEKVSNTIENVHEYMMRQSPDSKNAYLTSILDSRTCIEKVLNAADTEEQYYNTLFLNNMLDSFIEKIELYEKAINEDNSSDAYLLTMEINNDYQRIVEKIEQINLLQLKELEQMRLERKGRTDVYVFLMWILTALTGAALLMTGVVVAKRITIPVNMLVQYASEISQMQFENPNAQIATFKELQVLSYSLNEIKANMKQMLTNIEQKNLMEAQMKESKIEYLQIENMYKVAELKLLCSQINLHFLFNTLNGIQRMAFLSGNEETAQMIANLSDMLRYSLRNISNPVTLIEEITNLKTYINIQKMRFGEQLICEIEIETTKVNTQMPCLVLQPLVENAIKHGLEPYDYHGSIRVRAYDQGDYIYILITDNGIGIDSEKLDRIKGNKEDDITIHELSGIGISNVKKRIEAFCNEPDCFEICSSVGEGTSITIRLKG